ncbi:subtilase-type protease inhibitor [Streptomyces longispororuber]|uniref:Probable subtilase-type protease inhibitor n=1 Tax=Streptomyces longispororuber TaxID=68230 RepID=A0A918ZWH3_9ACTN|nr:subtilase-type protease inhibitor [Streptomyces longispororuber]GHE71291.1 subtilase-type protease inhibitor [Streptomyces longispororuber]
MRYITGGIALGAALALGGLSTTAAAGPAPEPAGARGYAPSELVLTIGYGEKAETASVQRAVTLGCSSGGVGSHPDAEAACAQLRAVGGAFDKVTKKPSDRPCTKEWNPIVVTAEGVWEGRRVAYEHTFANPCALNLGKGKVFAF